MKEYPYGVVYFMLSISCLLLIFPVVCGIASWVRAKKRGGLRKVGVSRMLIVSGCLLGSVWALRYAVGYFGICFPELSTITPEKEFVGLTWFEEISNSLVHALQTFSMDEDYTAYIISGKTMLREMFGADAWWQKAYGIYASVLNAVAPIVGGAVMFEILASIFPKIRLWLSHGKVWREKYYFSELNERSLALAKSIAMKKGCFLKKPVLIFTDAYVDDEKEKEAERVVAAKQLGAFCVKDDLAHVAKNRWGRRTFFLIDTRETANLQALTAMAEPANSRYLKKAEVYLFVEDDAYVQVEKQVFAKLKEAWQMQESPLEELPLTIVPVMSYRNMISNLLVELPLYEPLIHKAKESGKRDLTVTILGTGNIGLEMFLSTYWMGQILDRNLKINILSQEKEEQFWDKIDYINPEIRRTVQERGKPENQDAILQVNKQGERAPVYCEVSYTPCDVKSSEFMDALQKENKGLLDTDYFLVALGSDEDNISVANTVKRYVGAHHIALANKKEAVGRTVIAYVVYSPELSDTLNENKRCSFVGDAVDVYLYAVGNLRDVYSIENIKMTAHEAQAQRAHASYAAIKERSAIREAHKKRLKDDYKHWANLAFAMHSTYRMFSAGVTMPSRMDMNEAEAHTLKEKRRCMRNKAKQLLRAKKAEGKRQFRQGEISYAAYMSAVKTARADCRKLKKAAKVQYRKEVKAHKADYREARSANGNNYQKAMKENWKSYCAALEAAKKTRDMEQRAVAARKARYGCYIGAKKAWEKRTAAATDAITSLKKAGITDVYRDALTAAEQEYDRVINGADVQLLHRLAWLEHRRWNAFTRVKGFRTTKDYNAYASKTGFYKQMDIKLHPCLVECDQKGVRIVTDEQGREVLAALQANPNQDGFDLLDELTCKLHKTIVDNKSLNDYDFKVYDYPPDSGYRKKLGTIMSEQIKRQKEAVRPENPEDGGRM